METYASPKKRKLSLDNEKCVFCGKGEINNNYLQNLSAEKSDTLLSACSKIDDDISRYILSNEQGIRAGEHHFVCYHKTCRSTFLHPFYAEGANFDQSKDHASPFFTRSKVTNVDFDWKTTSYVVKSVCLRSEEHGLWYNQPLIVLQIFTIRYIVQLS